MGPPPRSACCCSCWCRITRLSTGSDIGTDDGLRGGAGASGGRHGRPEVSTHVSFDPPPCDELTISSPSGSATRVRPPGRTKMLSSAGVDDERAQVDVAGLELPVDHGGHRGQLHDRLRDPAARASLRMWRRSLSSSSCVARGPMTMPLPPEPSTGLTTSSPGGPAPPRGPRGPRAATCPRWRGWAPRRGSSGSGPARRCRRACRRPPRCRRRWRWSRSRLAPR